MRFCGLTKVVSGCHIALRFSALATLGLLPFATPAAPAEKGSQITVGGNLRDDRVGGSVSYLQALSGNLRKAGPLLRFGASSGETDDDYIVIPDNGSSSYSVEALAGWQSFYRGWRFRAFAGAIYRGRSGENSDTDGLGFKVMVQTNSAWSAPTYVNATASYDTATDKVVSRLQVGRHFGEKIIGPEGGVVWSSDSQRYDFGMFMTGVKLDKVGLSFRAGYSHNEGASTRGDSPYLGVSATYQF
ncbi:MAG: cellulose biosynthesis protein BcsS [Mesorhizobium sp.]